MAKVYTKNTWVDEVLADTEKYLVKDDSGASVYTEAEISLATEVVTAGTPVTASRMNNIETGIDALDTLINNRTAASSAASDIMVGKADGTWEPKTLDEFRKILGARIAPVVIGFTANCSTGDGKFLFVIPYEFGGWNLTSCYAKVITAGTTGTMDIQIRNVTKAQDMLSTKLTIDSGELGSDTAATPYVIDTTKDDVAAYDTIAIDIDAVHTTPAKGLIVILGFGA